MVAFGVLSPVLHWLYSRLSSVMLPTLVLSSKIKPSTISQTLSRCAKISAIERVWFVLVDVTTYCLTDGRANCRRRLSRGVVTYITSSRSIVIFPPLYNIVKLSYGKFMIVVSAMW